MPSFANRPAAAIDVLEHDRVIQARTVSSTGGRQGRRRTEYRLDLGQADPPAMTREEALATASGSKME